jgi:hypothetical protein
MDEGHSWKLCLHLLLQQQHELTRLLLLHQLVLLKNKLLLILHGLKHYALLQNATGILRKDIAAR